MSRTRQRSGASAATGTSSMFTAFEQAAAAASLDCKPGKQAVANRYQERVQTRVGNTRFTGSVDVDAAFAQAEPHAHRWDYGLGVQLHGHKECAVWVEPHPAASTREVKTMLAKLDWLQAKLRLPAFAEFKALTDECKRQGGTPFHWLATAHVAMHPGSREARMLAQRGLRLPGSKVMI